MVITKCFEIRQQKAPVVSPWTFKPLQDYMEKVPSGSIVTLTVYLTHFLFVVTWMEKWNFCRSLSTTDFIFLSSSVLAFADMSLLEIWRFSNASLMKSWRCRGHLSMESWHHTHFSTVIIHHCQIVWFVYFMIALIPLKYRLLSMPPSSVMDVEKRSSILD